MEGTIIRNPLNPNLEVKVYKGHFAANHSHNSHYIDITRMKHEHTMAREAGITLSQCYAYMRNVDTVVCLDGSEVIGAYLARHLAKKDVLSVNSDKNIFVVTPESDNSGQLIFRDNLIPMIRGKDVLLLISTVNSGKTAKRALECISYYGGRAQGIASVFSAIESVGDVQVYSIFSPKDIEGYFSHDTQDCPLCKAGIKIDGLVNSYGVSVI